MQNKKKKQEEKQCWGKVYDQHTLSLANYEAQYGVTEYQDSDTNFVQIAQSTSVQSTIQPCMAMDTCQAVPLTDTTENSLNQ